MAAGEIEISNLHWMMDTLQSLDVGLVIVDRDYRVQVWNGFMANHSGRSPDRVIGQSLFELFPDLPQRWFRRKAESVLMLRNRAFTTWEQRPYLFRFNNYRPITGPAEFMYQNVTFIPIVSADGEARQIGMLIYDVTDQAVSKLELEAANAKLEQLSRTDRLTQLNNRGYWEERLHEEFARLKRNHRPATLVMFDIDHFKKVNDTYGHQAGDEVIRHTAAVLRATIRTTDIAGRYGGEEFAVILVDTAAQDGFTVAERLRHAIAARPVQHEQQAIAYTISLGLAEVSPVLPDHAAWIERADQALYASKHNGRNRATVAAVAAVQES
jgi:diguanylate cyclase (GGDEF)-like protein